jgi:hypothetical protein
VSTYHASTGRRATIGELVSDLTANAERLAREQVALAREEMAMLGRRAGRDVAMIGAGALLGHAALLTLCATVILLLAIVIPLWAAALIVTIALAGGAYVLVRTGLERLRPALTPTTTLETMKENREWIEREIA